MSPKNIKEGGKVAETGAILCEIATSLEKKASLNYTIYTKLL